MKTTKIREAQTEIPKNPFVLVDGSSYLFRAFHALPLLETSQGKPTGAILGVVNMLRKLINDYQPERMAVVFDSKGKNIRHQKYPAYKANRSAMPEALQAQIEPLFALIRAMGLPLIVVPGVEADDIIGTLARHAKEQGVFTLISTGDKDFAQLVDDKTYLINTMSQEIFDKQAVMDKFGIPPSLIPDYFALIGDSVDNIPGVPKVGPKTALAWLEAYPSLANIMAHAGDISGKVGDNLRETLEQLPLFRELVTIDVTVPLQVTWESLLRSVSDTEALKTLYTEFEFKSWLKILEAQTSKTKLLSIETKAEEIGTAESAEGTRISHSVDSKQYEAITTLPQWEELQRYLKTAKQIAFQFHTTTDNVMSARLVGISIALKQGQAFYIPFQHDDIMALTQMDRAIVLAALQPILEDETIVKIGHHLKPAMVVLLNENIHVKGAVFDTMLESYALDAIGSKHELSSLAETILHRSLTPYAEIAGKGARQLPWDKLDIATATKFAGEELDAIIQLHQHFWQELKTLPSLRALFQDIEMPLVPVLAAMEYRGVLIDTHLLREQSKDLQKQITHLEKEIYTLAGEEFNVNSPKQLQEILYHRLRLPILEKTPTGQPSTAEPVLQSLAENYPLPNRILEYRSLTKLKSTYTDKLPQQVNAKTARVHTSYHQAVTSTGRLSSSDPNLQNIPIRSEEGRKIRTAFIAEKGYKIITADYSQIELRIMAHMSQDQALLQAFATETDIHTSTASSVFNVALSEVSSEQRRNAKAINFGLIYGMSAFGLAKQLGIERMDAEKYIEQYFASFPKVKVFLEQTLKQAKHTGYVETLLGRRLYLPDLNASHVQRRRASERAAVNAPMQGTNADIIKLAMIRLDAWLRETSDKVRMIMQVHDELVFEVHESFLEEALNKIQDTMENVVTLSVKLAVEIGVGDNWGIAQERKR